MTTEQKEYLDDMTAEFRPLIETIENGITTTRNHYARYGQALSYFSEGCPDKALTLMLIFKRAGANIQGLQDGYKTFIKPQE